MKIIKMKNFVFIVFILLSCQIKKAEVNNSKSSLDDILINLPDTSVYESEKEFIDRLYNCECDKYISKLIEIPNRDSNAYRITIKSKNGNWKKSSLINTRPEMSRISYCNDLYTVVSFPCGGPCHSEVFVFTAKDRHDEQYDYVQQIRNNPNFIAYIRNETFEKLIIHNLINSKEMAIDISDNSDFFYPKPMDSLVMKYYSIIIYYTSQNEKYIAKKVDITPILD